MGIEVFVANEQSDHAINCERWAGLAEGSLRTLGVRGDAELSVLFVDERAIAALNERYLAQVGPTDVLSFPIEDALLTSGPSSPGRDGRLGPTAVRSVEEELTLLGDVVICPAVAWRNAPEHAGTYDDEIALLLVHGILHLLGMDHEKDDEAEAMEAKEQELLDALYRRSDPPSAR